FLNYFPCTNFGCIMKRYRILIPWCMDQSGAILILESFSPLYRISDTINQAYIYIEAFFHVNRNSLIWNEFWFRRHNRFPGCTLWYFIMCSYTFAFVFNIW